MVPAGAVRRFIKHPSFGRSWVELGINYPQELC
jgi:hypothetical protein